jgi:hypothetical protein
MPFKKADKQNVGLLSVMYLSDNKADLFTGKTRYMCVAHLLGIKMVKHVDDGSVRIHARMIGDNEKRILATGKHLIKGSQLSRKTNVCRAAQI